MRTIGVVTTSRSDFGIYVPVLRRIQAEPSLRLWLTAAGPHLSPEQGMTVKAIEAAGFTVMDRVETLMASDSPEGVAKSIGLGVMGFAQVFGRKRPDILLVLGDRFEMYAAALAALPFKIPVAHIHGGEVTQGAFDDALRHSMTKLSHLHFVATEEYARRVKQLGEEPWRVVVTGAPGLDNLESIELMGPEELQAALRTTVEPAPLLVTFHPVTLEYERTAWQVGQLLEALEGQEGPIIFTGANADTAGRTIAERVEAFVVSHPNAHLAKTLGTRAYFSLMAVAAAMVGNSSSGIIEAPSFKLPVVNIGTRQNGRVRAANVIDVGYESAEIRRGLSIALGDEFRSGLRDLVNPYHRGRAAEAIVVMLRSVSLDDRLVMKRFCDLDVRQQTEAVTGARP
jgi:UDP-N-acetylglucosamine 2-epimerase (non-hydrolysing)/GDP/UDP-N,N'-diacetylbacillosamine 2-epimerase (hydrolysing)